MTQVAINLGRHVLADLHGCAASSLLSDADGLALLLQSAAVQAGATVLSSQSHSFAPQGATVVCMLAESHVSIHTWPESSAAAVDAYTCGDAADPDMIVDLIVAALRPASVDRRLVSRGGQAGV